MSRRQFLEMWEFHKRNPIDPVSLHQKPAALVAYTIATHSPAGSKRPLDDFLNALVPVLEEDEAQKWFDSL
ncbi:hypothetical protein ACIPR8_20010 [Stenotrophomonas sp. LARHCG68]|jgi:hypothetical protein